MAVLDALREYLRRFREPSTVHECRRCGTTVDSETESCPTCGGAEIAVYELQ